MENLRAIFMKNLRFAFMPSFWYMQNTYSKQLDEFILNNLNNIENIGKHTCKINGKTIWISNYPFSYGTGYGNNLEDYRPSRNTIIKLREAVINKQLKE